MASKMPSRTLYIFILGTGFPSLVAVRTFCLICCTLGFCDRSCRNSGCRPSNFSTRRFENMTDPTSSEPAPTRGLASRSVASRNISNTSDSMLSPPRLDKHDRSDQLGASSHARASLQIGGQPEHLEYLRLDALPDACERGLGGHPDLDQFVTESGDRIGRLPAFDLFLGPVARSVGRRVAADAVRSRVQQNRPAALLNHLPLAPESVDHRQGVVAVDALRVHLVRVDSRSDARDELHSHGLAEGLAAHPVEVVQIGRASCRERA